MLTTIDNPFDPFEQFSSWLLFDKEKGYDSCERLARLVTITEDMTQDEIDRETENAIELLIALDITDTFTKAYPKTH